MKLMVPGQALGMCVNLVARPTVLDQQPRACNVEVHGSSDQVATKWLSSEPGSTLLHFNVYANLAVGNSNNPRNSAARQARAAALLIGAPRGDDGAMDVAKVLRDDRTSTPFPIYGSRTLASWLLDVKKGTVTVWASSKPGRAPALHTWEISSFFGCPESKADKKESAGDGDISPRKPVKSDAASMSLLSGASLPRVPSTSSTSSTALPVQRGVHKLDLALRQELSKEMKEILIHSRDHSTVMEEVTALRKELLRQARAGELSEGPALQAFRLGLHNALEVWPLASVDNVEASNSLADTAAGSRITSAKLHEVDLLLRKELGRALAQPGRASLAPRLAKLRQEVMCQVRAGVLESSEAAISSFQQRIAQLAEEEEAHHGQSFLEI
eukprot:TRINITY_DN18062_c0_g1_i2.p1 TRINITY_DN18062_c0_g1~~TRINITY_DN18062_c0_g1_i2.p1  ORF type:complete len:385 (+),score=43.23 TRINITY_DN18062_c0_g1_i2:332-1486(+)